MQRTISRWVAATAACLGVAATAAEAPAPAPTGTVTDKLLRNGLAIEFSAMPAGRAKALMEGEFADVRLRITDEASGQPLRGVAPGVWMDMAQVIANRDGAEQKSCKDKIGLYLKGAVGIRPMIDLNSYYVVLMNNDASVSIVDPLVSMAGSTSTLATLVLKAPGADWAASERERRLYITMPRSGQLAVLDTESFKIVGNLDAGKTPVRVVQQPDSRFLWVGNNAADEAGSGVTVVDPEAGKTVAFVRTGAGHHEIAFSADSRHAFVTNRQAGSVSVIDVATHRVVKTLATGAQPLTLAHSPLSRTVYVADGKDGAVSVIDAGRLEVTARVALEAGLGPMRATPDGRFVLVLNPRQDRVHVIDTATHELVQSVKVAGEPFQITFSKSYAYVRSLHSERVSMINLLSLGKDKQAMVQSFAAGSQPPRHASGPALADSIASAANEGTVFVVNPSDGTTYFYAEGMNAPSSNYRVYGASPRAVTVVDRSLKEVEPGVYQGRVRIPAAGRYDVAMMLQSPQVLHCFSAEALENPHLAKNVEPLQIEYQTTRRQFTVGETAAVRFLVKDGKTGKPKAGVDGMRSLYFLAPGRSRTEVNVVEIGQGVYEARVRLTDAGAWYVYVGVPGLKLGYERLPYYSLQASAKSDLEATAQTR